MKINNNNNSSSRKKMNKNHWKMMIMINLNKPLMINNHLMRKINNTPWHLKTRIKRIIMANPMRSKIN